MIDYEKYIDNLIDLSDNIKINQISILTGKNGTGKSLIRKLMPNSISEQLNVKEKNVVASTSQEARTDSRPEFGALAGMMRDVGWTPTSTETIHNIKGLLKVTDRYIVIDEPEIGMGEETVAGLVKFLNENIPTITNYGILFITHNRYIVEHLNIDAFYNIEGMTKEEWLNREIIPQDLDELEDLSSKLFEAIRDRMSRNKKEKYGKN